MSHSPLLIHASSSPLLIDTDYRVVPCPINEPAAVTRRTIRLETAEWLTSGGKNVHCSLQYCGMKVASGDTGFVNSARTAGPIRTGDGSFDAPERRNDDGGGHVAPRATWHVPRAAA